MKVAEEGHAQVVHELIRVGARVDDQDNIKTFQHFHSDPREVCRRYTQIDDG